MISTSITIQYNPNQILKAVLGYFENLQTLCGKNFATRIIDTADYKTG
jgi:hypothetical protein